MQISEPGVIDSSIFRYQNVIQPYHCKVISDYILEQTKDNVVTDIQKVPWQEGDRLFWNTIHQTNPALANLIAHYRVILTQLAAFAFGEILHPVITDLIHWRAGRNQQEHIDDEYYNDRKYSAITYLNDDFEGGETFITTPEGGRFLSVPVIGDTLMFPGNAGFPHGVMPVEKSSRLTMAMWFHDDIQFAEQYYRESP